MKYSVQNGKMFIEGKEMNIDGFEVIKKIGCGANATTFLLHNSLIDRKEVIKVWHEDNKYGKLKVEKFLAETKKMGQLRLENVPTIYGADCKEDFHWCRMEYIDGKTLKEKLEDNPDFYIRYSWADSILHTLEEIYQNNIWHGDLHSKNVMIEEKSGRVYIIDFGTSILSGKDKSHKRDAKMLYELIYEILPEMSELNFITDKLCQESSKIICEILCIAIRMLPGIFEYKQGNLDEYGIKSDLVIPINIIQTICQEKGKDFKLEQNFIDSYFKSLNLDRKKYVQFLNI